MNIPPREGERYYALVKKSGHVVWREWWYTLLSRISL